MLRFMGSQRVGHNLATELTERKETAEPVLFQKHAGQVTCLPAPRAAQRGDRALQRMTPCCSAAHPRSPTPGCSCSATSGLAAGP